MSAALLTSGSSGRTRGPLPAEARGALVESSVSETSAVCLSIRMTAGGRGGPSVLGASAVAVVGAKRATGVSSFSSARVSDSGTGLTGQSPSERTQKIPPPEAIHSDERDRVQVVTRRVVGADRAPSPMPNRDKSAARTRYKHDLHFRRLRSNIVAADDRADRPGE